MTLSAFRPGTVKVLLINIVPGRISTATLLKLILGEIEPDAGLVRHGTRRNVAYFDQMRAQLDF